MISNLVIEPIVTLEGRVNSTSTEVFRSLLVWVAPATSSSQLPAFGNLPANSPVLSMICTSSEDSSKLPATEKPLSEFERRIRKPRNVVLFRPSTFSFLVSPGAMGVSSAPEDNGLPPSDTW